MLFQRSDTFHKESVASWTFILLIRGIPLTLYRRRGSRDILGGHVLPKLAMSNTADVTSGNPIAV
jgi:hypothetical protein